ncbi:NO-inducible flavohemoprotein [Akkermansiaceae bacterium]|nr:NO-inducible flavohemoprotein [Akkermansiaceae bacterium]
MSALSPETIATIKTTIPFLQENGVQLTEHFYKRMFAGNPEVKEYFNTSNQEAGVQQKALGGAICAFAQNLETPENLASAVSRISNKHASLGIKPEHYPIVGKHLLGSIDDLLDPAPPEILTAWSEAYGFLAEVLINAEKTIYKEQALPKGGWNGFRKMEVFKREHESQWITSFYLRPCDPCPVIPFKSGQYLTVRVPTSDGSTTMRNYSLSGSPEWDHYRISVKREVPRVADTPEGFVSSYLHTQVTVGDVLEIGPPCGDFVLASHSPQTPLLLLSGGVGLTPLLSMLHSVGDQPTTFLHAAINGESHALRDEVTQLAEAKENVNYHFLYSAPTPEDTRNANYHSSGLISQEFLADFITPSTHIYFCGPKPMMQHIYKALKAINHPEAQTHFEFFGPQEELEA